MNVLLHRSLAGVVVLTLLLAGLPAIPSAIERSSAAPSVQTSPEPVTSHPRLLLTAEDVPRLRSWATDANPMWRDGLSVVAEQAKSLMDDGTVPGQDGGTRYYEGYPTENYAAFFAFLSLVHPDEATRQDYATRARTLLMGALNEAVKGPAVGEPYRDPEFVAPASDRLRWFGENWMLTVDWIYPSLTTEDKATIRTVFLRWADEIVTNGYNRPDPVGLTNDPALYANRSALRWSGNNYFGSHIRNLGFMALALDPADDPGGELGAYLEIATGAHLYMTDQLLRTDAAGGMAPEGFEYSPQALGYVVQFLLALHTAGQDDPAKWGPQVVLTDNPFWDEVIPGFLHSISPQPTILPGAEAYGQVYQPAWYGDGEVYVGPDMIGLLGPLGRYDESTGNQDRLDAIRWIETYTPPRGAEGLISDRVVYAAGLGSLVNAIYYFMLFDPDAPAPTDPRPTIPLFHFAPGIGRLLARTEWADDAAWFAYALGWIGIDHQNADGNGFSFYRDGEWLTKNVVGYGGEYGDDDPSDDWYYNDSAHQNSLALENDAPFSNVPSDYRSQLYARGSQWEYVPAGDPTILAMSVQPGFAYALGDATNLYNSIDEGSMDILHASRSIVWLAPDTIVVYDRAESKTDGRFKRFWLNILTEATVEGRRATMTTATQQLVIDNLLPADAMPKVQVMDNPVDSMAMGEPMRYQFLVEAPGGPRETRFLNVLQGADAGVEVPPAVEIASVDESYAGAVAGTTAVLFPVDLDADVTEIRYTVPATTTAHLITGLTPGGGYDVAMTPGADGIDVAITSGDGFRADEGGALLIGDLPAALGTSSMAFTNELVPYATAQDDTSTEEAPPAETPDAGAPSSDPPDVEGTPGDEVIVLPDRVESPVSEGGEAASGEGVIIFEAVDEASQTRHFYRVAATEGAEIEDLSDGLEALKPTGFDEAVSVSPDGEWLLLGTDRLDPECDGWPCLAVVPADLSSSETVRIDGVVLHPDSYGAIASGGNLIVYPASGGPHGLDLWAITREGDRWSQPVLLTADSPYDLHYAVAFSADGSQIVFDCSDQPYADEGTAICEAATDGSAFRVVITPNDAPTGVTAGGAFHHPDYDPDGGIIFQSRWNDMLWRLPAGADEAEPVSTAYPADQAPCALADGRIASLWLGRDGNEGINELKVMTPDGSSYTMLVTDRNVEDIACGG